MAKSGRPSRADAAGKSPRVLVRFDGVSKHFGGTAAVDRLTLEIHYGEFFALLGPSGCGKTTLLRLLAGFETPDQGHVLLDGVDVAAVPPHRRPVNMMFQSYALFPHLTVAGNVGFGLRQEGLRGDEIAERVEGILELVKLKGFGGRRIEQLSGGQRQRVALARSLVKRPKVLLLDEPLAALDKKLRAETQFELMQLQRRLGTAFVIVTHDQEEAMIVADRIGVMNHGRLAQAGKPADIYERPNSRWVADFVGEINLLEGRLGKDGRTIERSGGKLRIAGAAGARPADTVWLALRPEKLRIALTRSAPAKDNTLAGTVHDIGYRGDVSTYKVRLDDGSEIVAAAANMTKPGARPIRLNDKVWLSWPPDAGLVLTK